MDERADALELLERIAVGVEKLGEDIVVQAESKPPHCPNCNRLNPKVAVNERAAEGWLAEFVIQARCTHCNSVLYALPILWECYTEIDHVREAVRERAELSGFNQNQN